MLALALVLYCTVARALSTAGLLQQYATALAIAFGLSSAHARLERRVAARPRRMVPADPAAADRSGSPPMIAVPIVNVLPELVTGKAFEDAVRRALTHLCDPTRLSVSPLLGLSLVTAGLRDQGLEDTRLQRVGVLKALLADLVQDLQPAQPVDGCIGASCRFYNCLYYPYVRGVTRRRAPAVVRALRERREREGGPSTEQERVIEWLLQVGEDTYYKWQRRASDTIALTLREREAVACGCVLTGALRAGVA